MIQPILTPFQEWWETHGWPELADSTIKAIAHAAWLAALEHARELMREEETE